MSILKPTGEGIFERYLVSRSLTWDYEPDIGGKHPDYLVHSAPNVLCEIEDLSGNALERELLASGNSSAGAWNPNQYVNNAIRRAARQLRFGKGIYPCVAVLYNDATMPYGDEVFITQAMFGDLQIREIVGANGALSSPRILFSKNRRYLTPTSNTTISAVAILEEVQPHLHAYHELQDAVCEEVSSRGRTSSIRENVLDALPRLVKLEDEYQARFGPEIFEKRFPRLRLYHNPWSVLSLPLESVGGGPFDEHLIYDLQEGQFRRP